MARIHNPVTRLRSVSTVKAQGRGKLPTCDDEVAVRNQTDAMTPGWPATVIFPMQATSAIAGLHSPKRTGWSC